MILIAEIGYKILELKFHSSERKLFFIATLNNLTKSFRENNEEIFHYLLTIFKKNNKKNKNKNNKKNNNKKKKKNRKKIIKMIFRKFIRRYIHLIIL